MTVSYRQPNSSSASLGYKSTRTSVPWEYQHPHIPQTFYAKLDAPKNAAEASRLQRTHEYAVKDFELQIKVTEIEQEALEGANGDVPGYKEKEWDSIVEKKMRLVLGLRFHLTAAEAFGYWIFQNCANS